MKELNDDQLKALDQLRILVVQHLEFRKLNTIKDKTDIQVEVL